MFENFFRSCFEALCGIPLLLVVLVLAATTYWFLCTIFEHLAGTSHLRNDQAEIRREFAAVQKAYAEDLQWRRKEHNAELAKLRKITKAKKKK